MHHFQSRPCSLLRTVSLCPRSAEDAGVASWEGRSRERKGPGSLSDRVEQSTRGAAEWGCVVPLGRALRSGAACAAVGVFWPAQLHTHACQGHRPGLGGGPEVCGAPESRLGLLRWHVISTCVRQTLAPRRVGMLLWSPGASVSSQVTQKLSMPDNPSV